MRRVSAIAWALVALLTPGLALACPACSAGQASNDFFWILGAMILLPFPTAGLVFWIIRQGEANEAQADPPENDPTDDNQGEP